MPKPLKILLLEDNVTDAEIVQRLLKKELPHFEFRLAMNKDAYLQALNQFQPDVILSDNSLPQFTGKEALEIIRRRSLHIPFILVSGDISEEVAVNIIKLGADDYILKDRLARLPAAIDAALKQRQIEKEKVEVQQKLIESENNLKQVMDNSAEMIWSMNKEHRLIIFNKAFYDEYNFFTGTPPVAGIIHYKAFNQEGNDTWKSKIDEALAGNLITFEQAYTIRNQIKYVEVFLYPIKKENVVEGITCFVMNITERKKALRAMTESENHLRTIYETEPECIKLLGSGGELIEMNPAGLNMIEADSFEMVKGKSVLGIVTPPYRDAFTKLIQNVFKGESGKLEFEITGLKGTHRWLETHAVPLRDESRVIISLLSITRDITERRKAEEELKESEKKYRTMVEKNPAGIYQTTPEGVIQTCNAAFARMLGYTPELLLKQNAGMLYFSNTDRNEFITRLQKTGELINNEIKLKHKDGNPVSMIENCFLHTNSLTGEQVIEGAVIDITTRKLAEEKLKESEERYHSLVEQASDGILVADFKGNIIEVNSALCSMFGYTRQEIMQKKTATFIDPEDLKLKPFRYDLLYKYGPILQERRAICKNGLLFDIEMNSKLLGEETVLSIIRDVSERKKAQEQIRLSEEKYRSFFEQSADAIFILDESGRFLDVNTVAANMLGYTKEELCNMSVFDITLKEHLAINPVRLDLVASGESVIRQRVFKRKDGTLVEAEVHSKKLPDGKFVAVVRDITERKKALKEISDYKFALDESSMVSVTDKNGTILHINDNFCRICKYSNEELIGQDHHILSSGYHSKAFMKNLWETITNGKVWRNEIKNKAKDGTYYWVDTTIVPFLDLDGKPNQYMTIRSDITERKNAETKMQRAFERYDILARATSDTIWDWNIVKNRMQYNEGITKMFGFAPEDVNNVVEWWKRNIHPDDLPGVSASLNEAFNNKIQTIQMQYRFRCANDLYKYIFDRAFVMFDETGKPMRMIGAMQDITYQKEEELRIGKAIIDAQELERHQLGMELHDNVNQILSASLLYLGMAKEKQKDKGEVSEPIEMGKRYIGEAITEIRRLSHHLAPVSFEDIPLKEVFESLINSMNTDNRFIVNLQFDEIEKNTISDDVQINLYRILQEQLNNIIKYSEANKVDISVTLTDQQVRLRIADNGKGFDAIAVKNGIGLENMRRRVKLFSGEINISSSPGNGCEILVRLPLKKND